jgi:hypothetical protein
VSEQHRRRIDEILDPEYLQDLEGLATSELRRRRSLCDDLDTELSYYRRLLHGRMDLLAFELRRRSGEEERSLIEALPEILAGSERAGPTTGRAVPVVVPEFSGEGRRMVDRALGDDFLARLPVIDDAELNEVQSLLTGVEGEVSQQRRAVYEVYEALQAELTRRYRDGLADVDDLLRG